MAKHILLTRESGKNEPWIHFLEKAGFSVSAVPMIETSVRSIEIDASEYDWIIFTSVNTVRYFFEQKLAIGVQTKIAVIGEKTAAAITARGYTVDFEPTLFTTDVFIEEWLALRMEKQRIFIPKSDIARSEIANQFIVAGHGVTECIIYETILPEKAADRLQTVVESTPIDMAVFASPSAWRHFLRCYNADLTTLKIVSIGPVTTKAIMDSGFAVTYEPSNYTMHQACTLIIERELV
ncbi:uroporphyrinogen-III synthase [Listeria grandensis]|uniref:Uroporphyrinogen-III synthase n=1 Tax=Listeria grandensis TaxID=1494963 RepID=A0A7X0Y1C8_9LIST|nr:uroporphyrinogen-III synthase [Listeria grandensis]MBC1934819.1 uroporphyrinogen-III synthase [Listeria grandensis]